MSTRNSRLDSQTSQSLTAMRVISVILILLFVCLIANDLRGLFGPSKWYRKRKDSPFNRKYLHLRLLLLFGAGVGLAGYVLMAVLVHAVPFTYGAYSCHALIVASW